MSAPSIDRVLGEKLVDARTAAMHLNLPLHWLAQMQQRRQRGIPHYRVGKLVRFKLGELMAWMQAQQPEASEEVADA
jgi:excisionase family DNA binding protein